MTRILVTGAAGFLGRHITAQALADGHSVVGIDLGPADGFLLAVSTRYEQAAIGSEEFEALIEGFAPEACVHCAGSASVPGSITAPLHDFECGPLLTMKLLDALRRKAPQCRFVMASSAAIYGDPAELPIHEDQPPAPVSPYGMHKLMSEQLCREVYSVYGMPTASVRIFSAYGEGLQRQVVWDICQKAKAGGPVKLQGSPAASRDFIHARDVAAGTLLVATNAPMRSEHYNLASGIETTIGELATKLCASIDAAIRVEFDGIAPQGTPYRWRADISKIRALGFEPKVALEDGLEEVVLWWKNLGQG